MLARHSTDTSSKYDGKSAKEQGATAAVFSVPDTIPENDENAKFGTTSAQHRRLVSNPNLGWLSGGG